MRQCLSCNDSYHIDLPACPKCECKVELIDGIEKFVNATKPGGFDRSFFEDLASLEAGNFWFKARNDLISNVVSRYAAKTKKYLEVGCGTGFVLQRIESTIPNAQIFASEYFVEGLAFSQQRVPKAKLMQMDGRNIPFVNEFDLIGLYDVIEHIDDDSRVLDELHKALQPSGVLILTVPQYKWLWSPADDYAHHQRRYTAKELHTKLAKAGFKIQMTSSFVTLLFPMLALSRLLSRKQTIENYDPLAEFSLPGWLNSALYKLLSIEVFLIGLGVRFPFGGSRVVVATKL